MNQSVSDSLDVVICPRCQSRLLADAESAGVMLLCARCRAGVLVAKPTVNTPLCRKAVVSLVLGLASFVGFFITGIPAVILGIGALRQIHRSSPTQRGKPFAIAGLTLGVVVGVLGSLWIYASVASVIHSGVSFVSTSVSGDEATRAFAKEIADFQLPSGLTGIRGSAQAAGQIREAVFVDDPKNTNVLVVVIDVSQYQQEFVVNIQKQQWLDRRKMSMTTKGSQTWTVQAAGKEVEVREASGAINLSDQKSKSANSQNSNRKRTAEQTTVRRRKYDMMIRKRDRRIYVMAVTNEPSADDQDSAQGDARPKRTLTREEVRDFFESFQ